MRTIVYDVGDYFVVMSEKGYEVYKTGATAATRVAVIGYKGQKGLDRAKWEIEYRRKRV